MIHLNKLFVLNGIVNSEIVANSVKRCQVKNSRLWHDLPTLVNDKVFLQFHEFYFRETPHPRSFTKKNPREVSKVTVPGHQLIVTHRVGGGI